MTKFSMPSRLSWMAAPIPPKPAPTMTASNCSEVMTRRYLRYQIGTGRPSGGASALDRARSRRVQRRDAGHRPVALIPRFGRRIQHVQLNGVVRHRRRRIARQRRTALVGVRVDGGLTGEVA